MDKINLEEVERLHKAATPGPWKEGRHDMFSIVEGAPAKYIYANSIPVAISTGEEKDCERVLADARYIVAACNAVPGLIAKVRELERQRKLMADGLELYCNYVHREEGDCPFWIECPNGRPCTGEVTDKMWIEFFERKAAKETGE